MGAKAWREEKIGVVKEFFCWKRAFCCEERVIYDIWYNKDTENLKRESQNQKTWSMTKKKVIRIFRRENGNFSGKSPQNFFCVPQTRRQVSVSKYQWTGNISVLTVTRTTFSWLFLEPLTASFNGVRCCWWPINACITQRKLNFFYWLLHSDWL